MTALADIAGALRKHPAAMRFDDEERADYARDGYVVRPCVVGRDELVRWRDVVEQVVARVTSHATRRASGPEMRLGDGHRIQFSSRTAIQWEWAPGSREIRLLEPFTHLDERFDALWSDPRLVEPMRDALGVDAVGPWTCKLTLKRPHEGSEFPWHQDYPYWYAFAGDRARDIATAILFLDDATADNGAIRVLPASHLRGPAARDPGDPTRFLADPAHIDASREHTVELAAGGLLLFSSLLLHRSTPNRSSAQRRAMLLSFQPAGRPRQAELPWRPERVSELP
jgi:ectoine hydroxylase